MTRPPRALMLWSAITWLLILGIGVGHTSETGHYAGGLLNIRDFAVPEPGFYGVLYNYYYTTSRLNDRHGDQIENVTIKGPFGGRRVTLHLDLDVDVYALAPTLIWVSRWKPLGARFGAIIMPTFANASVGAALSTTSNRALSAETSQFDIGDLYVQPIWLGWTGERYDVSFGMGFYAPTGKYDVRSVTVPRLGTIKGEAIDNIGLGFWTQQTQVAGYWYPFSSKGTAVGLALTHEVNTKKEDFALTPGQNLTLNWGVSQYLPLSSDQKLLLEVGLAGYDTWQVTADRGRAATNVRDEVHATGLHLGIAYVPWDLAVSAHWFHEFAAQDRFQGDAVGLSVAKKLF